MEILQTCYEKLLERIIIRREDIILFMDVLNFNTLISISYLFLIH